MKLIFGICLILLGLFGNIYGFLPLLFLVILPNGCGAFCQIFMGIMDILLSLVPIIYGIHQIRLYFFTKNLKKESKEATPLNKAFMVIAKIILGFTVVGIGISFCFNCLFYSSEMEDLRQNKFDKKEWAEGNYYVKSWMYQDLKDNYLKPGTKISDVLSLLGTPNNGRVYDSLFYKRTCLQYYLGTIGFAHTSYRLVICPDPTGEHVESVKYISSWWFSKYFDRGETTPQFPLNKEYNHEKK
jgi:hypothetical protein